jgi:hypothetical protein
LAAQLEVCKLYDPAAMPCPATTSAGLKLNSCLEISSGVARWYIFEPNIPIWVNFLVPCNGRDWYKLLPFDLFYGRLV